MSHQVFENNGSGMGGNTRLNQKTPDRLERCAVGILPTPREKKFNLARSLFPGAAKEADWQVEQVSRDTLLYNLDTNPLDSRIRTGIADPFC